MTVSAHATDPEARSRWVAAAAGTIRSARPDLADLDDDALLAAVARRTVEDIQIPLLGDRRSTSHHRASARATGPIPHLRPAGVAIRIHDTVPAADPDTRVVDATVVHDAGGGDAQEIGYALAVAAAQLRELAAAGHSVDDACRAISFRFAVTDRQFESIAKLRAARITWQRICAASGATDPGAGSVQHAVMSRPMMTRYAPHTNLLRATVAAFAALVGGADEVTVWPFDEAEAHPSELGRRLARTVTAILTEESGLAMVEDPAAGADALVHITAALAEAAWAELGRIEQGGISVDGNGLGAYTAQVRTERDRRVATRTQPITAVSEFPDPEEGSRPPDAVPRYRWAGPFEALRDGPAPRPVLLLRLGSESAASARVLFAQNLLAAGGITAELVETVPQVSHRAAIIVGPQRAYREHLGEAVSQLRAAGARAVFVVGAIPDGALGTQPVDGTVALGDDVLTFLGSVRDTVGVTS